MNHDRRGLDLKSVLYVLSAGHSGSTVTDLIVSRHSKIVGGGELSALPMYLATGKDCTCRKRIEECEFWSEVSRRGGFTGIDGTTRDARHRTILDNTSLFRAMSEVSGAEVVIDSSKSVRRLDRILREGIPTKVIHLTRDPRAVAFSHIRKQRNFGYYILSWQRKHFRIMNYLPRLNDEDVMKLRYEDLALRPAQTVAAIHHWLGLEPEPVMTEFELADVHNIDGNRRRFETTAKIRFDAEYIAGLGRVRWILASFITFRALRNLDYPITRRACRRWVADCNDSLQSVPEVEP